MSFDTLRRRFEAIADQLLSLGLIPQSRVAILARNSPAFIALEGACAAIGLTCVPVNFLASVTEVVDQLQHSRARALIFDPVDNDAERLKQIAQAIPGLQLLGIKTPNERAPLPRDARTLDPLVETEFQASQQLLPDTALHRIMYTSATTGRARGVMCPYGNWVANMMFTSANQLRDIDQGSRFLAASPLTHMSIGYFWTFFSRGASTVTMRRFRPDTFVDAVLRFGITHSLMVPTMIIELTRYLKNAPSAAADLRASNLRAIWYAGSPMPPAAVAEAQQILGPILHQQYGSTELFSVSFTMCATMLRHDELTERPGSCGRVIAGTAVRIAGADGREIAAPNVPGELWVKITGVQGGYLNDPAANEATFVDGWMRTGDIAMSDAEGYLTIVDRQKDMIISGGFNVYPAEVEAVLQTHQWVEHCAVVGAKDDKWVEVPVAFVMPTAGSDAIASQLVEYCRERLSGYKIPRDIRFVKELPLSAVGKVNKRRLRELL